MDQVRAQFITNCQHKRTRVSVHLANGIKLDGMITGQDETCILLDGRGVTQLVNLSSISTIMPMIKPELRANAVLDYEE